MGNDRLKKFFAAPGRLPGSISKDAYGAQQVNEHDVWINDAILGVTVRSTLDAQTVYNMVKAFWTNVEDIRKSAPYMKQVNLKYAARQENMDFHPGALKFYKEAGVIK